MTYTVSVQHVMIKCRSCGERFAPKPLQLQRELLIVCPRCLTPYLPAGAGVWAARRPSTTLH
jgi:hypothetical protein